MAQQSAATRKVVHADIKLNSRPGACHALPRRAQHALGGRPSSPASRSRCSIPTTTAAPPRSSSWRPAPWCRCTSTPRSSRPTCSKARSRTTRACAGRAVLLAAGRQPARGDLAQRRADPRVLPEAQPLRLRREVLHRSRRALLASSSWVNDRELVGSYSAGRTLSSAWLAALASANGRAKAMISPTMPRRNSSTVTTKIAPWMTSTHSPKPAR